jgi:hypothetical protein
MSISKSGSIVSLREQPQIVEPRKTVVVNQSLATSANFTVNPNLSFVPKVCIIRQLIYCNIAGTDNGTYLIWSSLTNNHIGCVYVGIQSVGLMPETTIILTAPLEQINFNITPANAAFTGPTGQFTAVLEFF